LLRTNALQYSLWARMVNSAESSRDGDQLVPRWIYIQSKSTHPKQDHIFLKIIFFERVVIGHANTLPISAKHGFYKIEDDRV
jgi:hypothetical protein